MEMDMVSNAFEQAVRFCESKIVGAAITETETGQRNIPAAARTGRS